MFEQSPFGVPRVRTSLVGHQKCVVRGAKNRAPHLPLSTPVIIAIVEFGPEIDLPIIGVTWTVGSKALSTFDLKPPL